MSNIVFDQVARRFHHNGKDIPAVDDVSFEVQAREFVAIVGPSGCGKTTCLRMAAGLEFPTSGSVTVGGKPVLGPGPDRSVVFQQFALFPWKTVVENIDFGFRAARVAADERRSRIARYVELMGLQGYESAFPHQLSGGMQQRVAIARALAYNPAVLLMDEPFAALDALTRDDMQRLLAEVWRTTRKTVIYVTHNVAEAVFLADRVVVMTPHPGTVKTEVPIRLARPRDPLSVEFLNYQKELLRLLGQDAKGH